MLKVGLTGGIGSGKSLVSREFENLGITVVDADVVAKEAVAPGEPALATIAERFGGEILLADGSLNRPKLREIVFNSEADKKWLEGLLHPLVRQRIVELLASAKSPYSILASPLLVETQQTALVDKVIVVDVDEATQIERACDRDRCQADLVRRIMASQLPREARLAKADYVIDNSGTRADTAAQVQRLHQTLLTLADC